MIKSRNYPFHSLHPYYDTSPTPLLRYRTTTSHAIARTYISTSSISGACVAIARSIYGGRIVIVVFIASSLGVGCHL
jgi:hypothetical protein